MKRANLDLEMRRNNMDDFTVADSLRAWEANAAFWDESMGDASNSFHREVVRPRVSELLDVHPGELILEAGCGKGTIPPGWRSRARGWWPSITASG